MSATLFGNLVLVLGDRDMKSGAEGSLVGLAGDPTCQVAEAQSQDRPIDVFGRVPTFNAPVPE